MIRFVPVVYMLVVARNDARRRSAGSEGTKRTIPSTLPRARMVRHERKARSETNAMRKKRKGERDVLGARSRRRCRPRSRPPAALICKWTCICIRGHPRPPRRVHVSLRKTRARLVVVYRRGSPGREIADNNGRLRREKSRDGLREREAGEEKRKPSARK